MKVPPRARPAQRRLGILSADRVEDHPGGVAGEFPDAGFQVLAVVVHGGLGATLTAQLKLFRAGRRGQHPGLHRDRQIDGGQSHPARGAQHDNPFPLLDFGYRAQSVISGAVGDAERRGRSEVRVVGHLRDAWSRRAALARRTRRTVVPAKTRWPGRNAHAFADGDHFARDSLPGMNGAGILT